MTRKINLILHSERCNTYCIYILRQYQNLQAELKALCSSPYKAPFPPLFRWIRHNLSPNSRIFVNLRDFSPCMLTVPHKQFRIINFLSSLPAEDRIFGIAYEEGGRNLPEQLAVWTATTRKLMDK